jgi:4-hydroxy-2-oxoheptanedioate aldolase
VPSLAPVNLQSLNHGLFVKLPSTQVLEIAAGAGFDFCVLDLEHSQLGESEAIALASHASALRFPAIVRLPELDRGAVNRLLEAGASGIQLSSVRKAAQVHELRRATRYAPEGNRSISLAHAGGASGATPTEAYPSTERARTPFVIAQIETADTDDPLDEIITAGPDVVFIGTADLNADVGLDRGAFDRRVAEICDRVVAAGVTLGSFGLTEPRVTYRVTTSDLALLRSAAADAVRGARQ